MTDYITIILTFISGIPQIGPYLKIALQAIMIIAGVMTALSVFASALLNSLAVMSNVASFLPFMAKLKKFADILKMINDKIQPYLKYASIFNVQKK